MRQPGIAETGHIDDEQKSDEGGQTPGAGAFGKHLGFVRRRPECLLRRGNRRLGRRAGGVRGVLQSHAAGQRLGIRAGSASRSRSRQSPHRDSATVYEHAGGGGTGPNDGRARSRLCHPAQPGNGDLPRHAAAFRARGTTRPADANRRIPALAGRGSGRTVGRRHPFGNLCSANIRSAVPGRLDGSSIRCA